MQITKYPKLVMIFFIVLTVGGSGVYAVDGQVQSRNNAFRSIERDIKDCMERGFKVTSNKVTEIKSANKFEFICSDGTVYTRYYEGSEDIILMGGKVKDIEEVNGELRLIISYTYKIKFRVDEIFFHLYPVVVLGTYPTTGGNTVHCLMWAGFRGSSRINRLFCG